MSSLATVGAESMLSSFSTSLLGETVDDEAIKKEIQKEKTDNLKNREWLGNNKVSGNALSGSYNLSSVLSNIQDNGPACDQVNSRREGVDNKAVNDQTTFNHTAASCAGINQVDESDSDSSMTEDVFHLSSNQTANGKILNFITPTQLSVLLITSVVIVGAAMYKLDAFVKDSIQQTVQTVNANSSVIKYENNSGVVDRDLMPSDKVLPPISKALAINILEIDVLEADVLGTDALDTDVSKDLLEHNETVLIASSVSTLSNEIRSLRKELELVKKKINMTNETHKTDSDKSAVGEIISNNTSSGLLSLGDVDLKTQKIKSASVLQEHELAVNSTKTEALISKTPKETTSQSKIIGNSESILTVKLASLSNEEKVNKISKRLEASGLIPLIEEASVKGENIYRISVTGFTDIDEAKLFINNAADKYGVKGSKIIKS